MIWFAFRSSPLVFKRWLVDKRGKQLIPLLLGTREPMLHGESEYLGALTQSISTGRSSLSGAVWVGTPVV